MSLSPSHAAIPSVTPWVTVISSEHNSLRVLTLRKTVLDRMVHQEQKKEDVPGMPRCNQDTARAGLSCM